MHTSKQRKHSTAVLSGMLTQIHPIMSITCVHSTDSNDRVCKHATIMIFKLKCHHIKNISVESFCLQIRGGSRGEA